MKVVLTVLAVLNILGSIIGCMLSFGTNVILAILILAGGIVSSAPYFALIGALEDIAVLRGEQLELKGKLRRLMDAAEKQSAEATTEPAPAPALPQEISRHAWKCVKCQTINKPGTSECSGCGARYSPWVNGEE